MQEQDLFPDRLRNLFDSRLWIRIPFLRIQIQLLINADPDLALNFVKNYLMKFSEADKNKKDCSKVINH